MKTKSDLNLKYIGHHFKKIWGGQEFHGTELILLKTSTGEKELKVSFKINLLSFSSCNWLKVLGVGCTAVEAWECCDSDLYFWWEWGYLIWCLGTKYFSPILSCPCSPTPPSQNVGHQSNFKINESSENEPTPGLSRLLWCSETAHSELRLTPEHCACSRV